MFLRVFYILGIILRPSTGYEIDEYELITSTEYEYSSEEQLEDVLPILESIREETDIPVAVELPIDHEVSSEVSPAGSVSFSGPVQAKGTVLVGAKFGYDSPHISPSVIDNVWYPQYYLPPFSPLAPPTPFTAYHIPLLSMFLRGIESSYFSENTIDNLIDQLDSTEIFLKATSLKDVEVATGKVASDPASLPESRPLEEVLANSEEVFEDDFPDYDAVEEKDLPVFGESSMDSEVLADGVAFGGYLPVNGTVTIAARY